MGWSDSIWVQAAGWLSVAGRRRMTAPTNLRSDQPFTPPMVRPEVM
jgi:hypothetical protein